MIDTQIILFGLWVALMLVFLLGDVLRIFAGDFKPGEIMGEKANSAQWLVIAVMMVLPILMAILTLILDQPFSRMLSMIMASLWFLFNLVGLPTYKANYDRLLLVVGMFINILTFWYAFNWI